MPKFGNVEVTQFPRVVRLPKENLINLYYPVKNAGNAHQLFKEFGMDEHYTGYWCTHAPGTGGDVIISGELSDDGSCTIAFKGNDEIKVLEENYGIPKILTPEQALKIVKSAECAEAPGDAYDSRTRKKKYTDNRVRIDTPPLDFFGALEILEINREPFIGSGAYHGAVYISNADADKFRNPQIPRGGGMGGFLDNFKGLFNEHQR